MAYSVEVGPLGPSHSIVSSAAGMFSSGCCVHGFVAGQDRARLLLRYPIHENHAHTRVRTRTHTHRSVYLGLMTSLIDKLWRAMHGRFPVLQPSAGTLALLFLYALDTCDLVFLLGDGLTQVDVRPAVHLAEDVMAGIFG